MLTLGILQEINESMKLMFLAECFAHSNAHEELITTTMTNRGNTESLLGRD